MQWLARTLFTLGVACSVLGPSTQCALADGTSSEDRAVRSTPAKLGEECVDTQRDRPLKIIPCPGVDIAPGTGKACSIASLGFVKPVPGPCSMVVGATILILTGRRRRCHKAVAAGDPAAGKSE
jgi:hypothetical protein